MLHSNLAQNMKIGLLCLISLELIVRWYGTQLLRWLKIFHNLKRCALSEFTYHCLCVEVFTSSYAIRLPCANFRISEFKVFYLADFIPSHLALVSCLSLLILQTAVWQPLMPPWESKASFISSAFVMLCFSFTHSFIWDFIGEIFRSQMSLPL